MQIPRLLTIQQAGSPGNSAQGKKEPCPLLATLPPLRDLQLDAVVPAEPWVSSSKPGALTGAPVQGRGQAVPETPLPQGLDAYRTHLSSTPVGCQFSGTQETESVGGSRTWSCPTDKGPRPGANTELSEVDQAEDRKRPSLLQQIPTALRLQPHPSRDYN